MPSQFPISSPYPFEKDKGIGFGSFYCGCTHHEAHGIGGVDSNFKKCFSLDRD
jgi:hypothetical protein